MTTLEGGGIPAVPGEEAFPTGKVAVNPEAGVSHAAHRFPAAARQQAQDIAAEEGELGSVKCGLKRDK